MRCAVWEIKSRAAMAKTAFKKNSVFPSILRLNLRKKLVKCYIWSIAWLVLKLGHVGKWREIPGKFSNVVLEKDGEDQLDRSCEK